MASGIGRRLRGRRAAWTYAGRPELAAPAALTMTSPSFGDGGAIPLRHSGRGRGENVSPALAWSGVPSGTVQLLLLMEDPDVPLGRPIVHTLAVVEPDTGAHDEAARESSGTPEGTGGLPEGGLNAKTPAPGVRLLPGTAGRRGYHGPRPLAGHGPHHYGFHLYALDRRVPEGPLGSLLPLVAGHVLAAGHLVGVQEHA
jgi:phosphatidylethanolamine-binding protein (PEBP) family uncharacterized protein